MLNTTTVHDALAVAVSAAPSLRGNCVQLADVLNLLSGADMRELAACCPFEVAALSAEIKSTLAAALELETLAQQLRAS